MPKIVTVKLESTAPYSQSRKHDTPKLEKETADAYGCPHLAGEMLH